MTPSLERDGVTSCTALIELKNPPSDKHLSCTYLGVHSTPNPPPNGRCQRSACRECAILANQGKYMKGHQYTRIDEVHFDYCFFSPGSE